MYAGGVISYICSRFASVNLLSNWQKRGPKEVNGVRKKEIWAKNE
jgi:hypothetical protein